MKTRTDLLNHLATKYQLKTYLEIGVQNPSQNFDKIQCGYKISVDPDKNAHATICMTSDRYFDITIGLNQKNTGIQKLFDLIFIDGLHTAEQVKKDFENALKVLSPNGFIVLHDCNPLKEEYTIVPRPTKTGHWNGDVFRFAITLVSKTFTNDQAFTVDIDNGMVVYRAGQEYRSSEVPEIVWAEFDRHRKHLLNLVSWDEFVAQ